MAAMVRGFDWASTPLGRIDAWPQCMRTSVEMALESPLCMCLLWGPELILIYNDAYAAFAAERHPGAFGRRSVEAWPEAWESHTRAVAAAVFAGETRAFVREPIPLVRGGTPATTWMNLTYSPVRDDAGVIVAALAILVDVTAQVRAEAELRRLNEELERRVAQRTAELQASEIKLGIFYDHATESHALLRAQPDGDFVFEDLNPAVLRLYGLTREQAVGHATTELFDAETAAAVNANLSACLQSGEPYRYERRIGDRIVEASCVAVPGIDGGLPLVVATARDVTAARRLEEQLRQSQKMDAVGQLTGGIAHDFNNLLQGIIGSLNLVESRVVQGRTDDIDRFIQGAISSADRAAALTHRLLAFSRRQALDPKPVAVQALVGSLEDLLSRTMGERIAIKVTPAAGLWPTLCDPNQLESSLLNLAINARDAIPDGGRLTIALANVRLGPADVAPCAELPAGEYVSISVSDTGTGMTPDVLERAFEPFFTTKPTGQGTGLGLSMVYGFCRQSDGHIRIDSEPGRGTTVTLFLPRYRGVAATAPPAAVAAPAPGDGQVVLVVEDEPVVRGLIVEVLGELGYRVIEAADGPAGLGQLEARQRIDLLVTDIGLPGLNGRQIADAGRLRRPGLKVLFMTGYAETAMLGEGVLETGMAMITKPFAMDALAARVHAILRS
jgi:PAS domain S-box-containing protein